MKLTRRDLIKSFGALAFLLTPVARAMGYVAGGTFVDAPRFLMFFKGGSFHPASNNPASIMELAGTPLEVLQPHAQDLILFKKMSIHGGSPKTDGYKEEHAAGLIGCVTGHSYHYSKNDSYYAYTDNESIDIAIANHYKATPALAGLPFASLHVGAGAQSDADNVGLGQRYISYRKRQSGDAQYGNAIEPVQDAGQLYDTLMERVQVLCSGASNQPVADKTKLQAALKRKQSLIDFRLQDISDAKRRLGMDSEHSRKLDGLVAGWRDVESAVQAELNAGATGAQPGTPAGACPTGARPTGKGAGKQSCDDLSPVHDQMIGLIKLAFEWDLTRVIAYTLSGASCGQRWPSMGVNQAHHTLEHSNNVAGQNIMGKFYAGKFAQLLTALKSIDDGQGQTALFNSSVILGMECWSDSSSGHYLRDIPFILAGQGAGKFKTGRIVDAGGRNNNDLLISVQNASGITSNVFGLESLCKGPIV
ncbi:MAG TPA: DUF1552 domain-containing protein [Polyangiales bacterium]|nr:DUF1552 domain-containing protein [Polyangiales bacterium]